MHSLLLLPDLLPAELRTLSIRRHLAPGQTLFSKGDHVECIFAVDYGRLQVFSCTSEGKPVPLYRVHAGECVCEASLFAEQYCGDAVTEARSSVIAFPKRDVLRAFAHCPQLAADLMAGLTRRFQLLQIGLELRNLQSAKRRLLEYLNQNAHTTATVVFDRPLKSIADEIGLAHETFYRALADLVRDGEIFRSKGAISIRNRFALHHNHSSP